MTHNDAMFTSMSIKKGFEQPESSIKALVDSDFKKSLIQYLQTKIAQVIHFCGKLGIALRGHNEQSALLEMFALEGPTLRDNLKKPHL